MNEASFKGGLAAVQFERSKISVEWSELIEWSQSASQKVRGNQEGDLFKIPAHAGPMEVRHTECVNTSKAHCTSIKGLTYCT